MNNKTIIISTGVDLDEAITMFVNKMAPEGTQISRDSLIKGVESNQEKTKRIEELEARELRFTGQTDKLEGDLQSLKAQFERYCEKIHAGGNNSNISEQQFSESSVAHSMTTSLHMSQAVVQHFNALSIDLRKFFTQMEMGDEVLKPFSQLSIEFQRNKSTKAARSEQLKLYNYMKGYPGGPEACITNFSKLTSQLYDKEVKQSREHR